MRNGIDRGVELDSPHPIRQPGDQPDDLSVDDVAHSGGAESVQDEAARLVGESEALPDMAPADYNGDPDSGEFENETRMPTRTAKLGGQMLRADEAASKANSIKPAKIPDNTYYSDNSEAHYHKQPGNKDARDSDHYPAYDLQDAFETEQDRTLAAEQDADFTPQIAGDRYHESSVDQYVSGIRKFTRMNDEKEQKLGEAIRAGAEAQETINILDASADGTLDKLKETFSNARLKYEKKLIYSSQSKKSEDLTDAEIMSAKVNSDKYVEDKITAALAHIESGENRSPITSELDNTDNMASNKVRSALELTIAAANDARNELVEQNLFWAVTYAGRFHDNTRNGPVGLSDVVQAANIGLIEAARNFDPEKGVRFSTYAARSMHGKIVELYQWDMRSIRLPRHIEDMLAKIKELETNSRNNGTDLNEADIAADFNLTVSELHEIKRISETPQSFGLVPETPLKINGGTRMPVPTDALDDVTRQSIIDLFGAELTPEEQHILLQVGVAERTKTEVGKDMRMTLFQVTHRLNNAIAKLRYGDTGQKLWGLLTGFDQNPSDGNYFNQNRRDAQQANVYSRTESVASPEDITDEQWKAISPVIPSREHLIKRGKPRVPDQQALDGILWVFRTGERWEDLPDRYPSRTTCHDRFKEWNRNGTFGQILLALARDMEERGGISLEECFNNGSPAGAKNGRPAPVTQNADMTTEPWLAATSDLFRSPEVWRMLTKTESPWLKQRVPSDLQTRLRDIPGRKRVPHDPVNEQITD